MTTKTLVGEYGFDGLAFGRAVLVRMAETDVASYDELAIYSNHYNSGAGIRAVVVGEGLPSIRGFLDLCNLLALCPTDFWEFNAPTDDGWVNDDIPF